MAHGAFEAASLSLACLAAGLVATLLCNQAQQVAASKIKVEGWTEVRQGWPLKSDEYFVATEKGHHFIELRDIPTNLDGDLDVHLEYYYNYSRARPVVQMIPCRSNIYLVDEHSDELSNRWQGHNIIVRREDCIQRNELAYNILLHDPGDVFAWASITVRTVPHMIYRPTTTTASSSTEELFTSTTDEPNNAELNSETTPAPTSPSSDLESDTTSRSEDETTTTMQPLVPEDNQNELEKMIDDDLDKAIDSSTQTPGTTAQPAPLYDPTTTQEPTTSTSTEARNELEKGRESDIEPQEDTRSGPKNPATNEAQEKRQREQADTHTLPERSEGRPSEREKDEESQPTEEPEQLEPTRDYDERAHEATTATPSQHESERNDELSGGEGDKEAAGEDVDDEESMQNQIVHRYKRMAGDESQKFWEVCRPTKCDRSKFKMARFSPIISGVPRLPAGVSLSESNKLFLNLNNNPFKIKLESRQRLSEVDSCLMFRLFLEKEAELELLLEEPQVKASEAKSNQTQEEPKRGQILEIIRREAAHSSAGNWEQFQRCISDYMPRLDLPGGAENAIRFQLKSRPDKAGTAKAGRTAILLSTEHKQAGYLTPLFPTQSYLPDVRLISNPSTLDKFWIMDRDGLNKPKVELVGQPNGAGRVLKISNIEPSQESFDITSRWVAVKGADLLEQPVLLVYRAKQAAWVKRIELQYQRAGGNYDDWLSQVAYAAPSESHTQAQNQSAATATAAAAAVAAASSSSNATAPQPEVGADSEPGARLIDLPIRLKGLDSGEFRVRLRHHLVARKAAGSSTLADMMLNSPRSLEVRALALADACTYRQSYCLNGGMCRPTGPAQAECLCLQGYSGAFCQLKKPCEILYGDRTGSQICQSVGARCVQGLPVMRCEWPNDSYYQCQKLYKLDAEGKLDNSTIGSKQELGATSGSQEQQRAGSGGVLGGVGKLADGRDFSSLPAEEQVGQLRGIVNQQAKLVIILAVFIVAILVFALVLVGSMVARLRKSSRRLKQSQSDFQQMARRVSETPGNSNFGTSPFGRAAGARVGFSNSSFDVE